MMHLPLFPMTEPENKGGKLHGDLQKESNTDERSDTTELLPVCVHTQRPQVR